MAIIGFRVVRVIVLLIVLVVSVIVTSVLLRTFFVLAWWGILFDSVRKSSCLGGRGSCLNLLV